MKRNALCMLLVAVLCLSVGSVALADGPKGTTGDGIISVSGVPDGTMIDFCEIVASGNIRTLQTYADTNLTPHGYGEMKLVGLISLFYNNEWYCETATFTINAPEVTESTNVMVIINGENGISHIQAKASNGSFTVTVTPSLELAYVTKPGESKPAEEPQNDTKMQSSNDNAPNTSNTSTTNDTSKSPKTGNEDYVSMLLVVVIAGIVVTGIATRKALKSK